MHCTIGKKKKETVLLFTHLGVIGFHCGLKHFREEYQMFSSIHPETHMIPFCRLDHCHYTNNTTNIENQKNDFVHQSNLMV